MIPTNENHLPVYYQSMKIHGQKIREDVYMVMERKKDTKIDDDLKYLFEVYNIYIAEDWKAEKITCGACRIKVYTKLKQYCKIWEEYGFEYE